MITFLLWAVALVAVLTVARLTGRSLARWLQGRRYDRDHARHAGAMWDEPEPDETWTDELADMAELEPLPEPGFAPMWKSPSRARTVNLPPWEVAQAHDGDWRTQTMERLAPAVLAREAALDLTGPVTSWLPEQGARRAGEPDDDTTILTGIIHPPPAPAPSYDADTLIYLAELNAAFRRERSVLAAWSGTCQRELTGAAA